jgi:hypothetical protein
LLTLDDISEVFQIYGAKLAGANHRSPPSNPLQAKPEGVDA